MRFSAFFGCCFFLLTSFCDGVQDSGDDGWDVLAPIDVNPKLPIVFGDAYQLSVDSGVITASSQSWIGSATDNLGIMTKTVTSDGHPMTTTVTNHAQLVQTTTTSNGKASIATNLIASPKLSKVLDNVRNQALDSCPAKRKRRAIIRRVACNLQAFPQDKLVDLLKAELTREGIQVGTKVLVVLATVWFLGAETRLSKGVKVQPQYIQPVRIAISDVPNPTTSDGPIMTGWTDHVLVGIEDILALSIPTSAEPAPTDIPLAWASSATPSPTTSRIEMHPLMLLKRKLACKHSVWG